MTRRVLITGAAGFAGSHLLDLLTADPDLDLVAWRRPGEAPYVPRPAGAAARPLRWLSLDLRDREGVAAAVADAQPAIVYHLAGAAHVGAAWARTSDALAVNALATHHVIEGARRAGLTPRILIPSSAYVYRPSEAAIGEDWPIGPNSPYGVSKLAQEMIGFRAWEDDGIPVVVARAFNHVGPRQDPSFSTSSFARQIATIEAGATVPVIQVGNLSARRDLTDVRDTVRAYRLIADHGRPGRVYNVCRGVAYPVSGVLDGLLRASRIPIEIRVDAARLRPSDTPVVLGDGARLREELGWRPAIPFEQTLGELLDYWRGAVNGAAS